jgi:putative ABC transport system permease protein
MLKQILEITWMNLLGIRERLGLAVVVIVGLAGVVGVFTALLAMSRGFEATLAATGSDANAIVLRSGSNAELNSVLSVDALGLVEQLPGVRRAADGSPLASGEIVVISELPRRGERLGANVTLRGVGGDAFELRPNFRIVEGRRFEPGLQELIVGRGVSRQFEGATLGGSLRLRGQDWTVVGVFETGDSFESEIWTDVRTAQTAWGRNAFSIALVGLEDAPTFDAFKAAVAADPRLNVDIERERAFYSGQTGDVTRNIGFLASVVAVIMGLGAIFAALNTMYAAVSARTREIATLRALGFRGLPVVVSVLVESMALAVAGGLAGAVLAYLLFNGMTVSTLGGGFTQVVFAFKVTPDLLVRGVMISLVIGFIGGLLPAIRAARLPVTTALRAA